MFVSVRLKAHYFFASDHHDPQLWDITATLHA